jgi:sugar O-acyltransferase (sialic acid O-acetyltransferase NeuD family)
LVPRLRKTLSLMNHSDEKSVIVLGAGGHARVLVSMLKRLNRRILGATCLPPIEENDLFGIPILGDDDEIKNWNPQEIELVNGIGMITAGESARHENSNRMRALGYRFLEVVDPSAFIAPEATVSEGAQVMAGAIIQPGAIIGKDSIINTGAQVDHDCVIGEGSHVCPGSLLAGDVRIGQKSIVGSGSVIIPRIHVGSCRMIRAGSIITSNVD